MVVLGSALLACFALAAQFDAAEPIWTTAERGEINSTIAFATRFEWDGEPPHLWDETSSFLGRTYPTAELKYTPSVDWWKRTIEPKAKFAGEVAKVDATRGVRYEGAINDTGFLRLKVKVSKPGRLLVGFDEILVGGKLDFLNRFGCNNVVLWDVNSSERATVRPLICFDLAWKVFSSFTRST